MKLSIGKVKCFTIVLAGVAIAVMQLLSAKTSRHMRRRLGFGYLDSNSVGTMKFSTGCIIVSFAIALVETCADGKGGTTIRLHKIPDEDYIQSLLQVTEAHYRDENESSLSLSSVLYRQKMARYYSWIGIGSPTQYFRVVFDTASANLIVPTVGCQNCGTRFIDPKNKYDSSASETYESDGDMFHISYPLWVDKDEGDPGVSGYFSVDDVKLAVADEVSIALKSQRFAEMQDASGLALGYIFGEYDGIAGLGFTALSIGNTATIMDNAISQNAMNNPMFSIYVDREDNGSEIMLGDYDPTKFTGKLVTIPLVRATYWEIAIDSVSAGNIHIPYNRGRNTSLTNSQNEPQQDKHLVTAIIDSSNAWIFGPVDDVALVAEAVGATKQFLGFYRMEHCNDVDSMPDVVFTINGVPFSIPGPSLIFKVFHYCLLAVLPIDLTEPTSPDWILGDLFMRQYYMVFNLKRETISMAKAIQQHSSDSVAVDK